VVSRPVDGAAVGWALAPTERAAGGEALHHDTDRLRVLPFRLHKPSAHFDGPPKVRKTNLKTGQRNEGPYGSGQDSFYDIPVDVRKSEVTPGIPIRQPTMIEAEQVKNGRMQVVKVYLILDRVVAVVIRGTP
jgi:hypothetical protein